MSQGTNSLGFGSYYFLHTQEPMVGKKLHEEVGPYTMFHCKYKVFNPNSHEHTRPSHQFGHT